MATKWSKGFILWAVFAAVLFVGKLAYAQEAFDEIFKPNGEVRAEYKEAYDIWSKLSEKDKKQFLIDSKKAFQGDNALDAMPRMITANEYDSVLKPGVEQRARAIRAFLQDHYSGARLYQKNQVIPENVIKRLIQRSNETAYDGLIVPQDISFFYGPDIIKDRKGTWRVIEDNPGFIGGVGDLKLAQEYLLKRFPELAQSLRFRSAEDFYKHVTDRYKERAAKHNGRVIMYMTPPYPDNEDKRMRELFGKHGVDVVTSYSNKQMVVKADGVYVYDRTRAKPRLDKVGLVILNGEHSWLDTSHPANYTRLLVEEAQAHLSEDHLDKKVRAELEAALAKDNKDPKELRRIIERSNYQSGVSEAIAKAKQARHLTEAILRRQVDTNYTPGVDFIGDKEFYLYVEKLVEFYLKETPIIKNIPTQRFAIEGTARLDQKIFETVFSDMAKYVIKKVDGRGGDAVWVGPKVSASEIPALKERILKNPAEYIVQEFTPLSRMNNNIVDIRVITDVGPNGIYVTDTPWGRGLPVDGNGKVNLSDQGREITVLVHEGRWGLCKNVHIKR